MIELLLVGVPALAASVTLSPGDDIGSLTSSLQPGDVVTFNGGTYELEGTVYWTGVGSEDAPITLKAAAGAPVVLKNNGGGWVAQLVDSSYVVVSGLSFSGGGGDDLQDRGPSGLYVRDSDTVRIEDCTVEDVWGTALRLDGNLNNLVVRHNELSNTGDGSGIYVGCGSAECWMQDSLVEFNLVHDIQGSGIYLSRGTQNVRVQHNVVFRIRDDGLATRATEFGPQNVLYGNAVWQVEDDGIFVDGPALVQNNLVFEVGGDGLYSRDEDGSLFDVQISHNTFARTDGWGARLDDWYDKDGLVFANNAIANPTGLGVYWDDQHYDDNGYGTTTTASGEDTSNYIANNVVTGFVDGFEEILRPTFVVPGGGVADFESIDDFDFYPTSNSTLRDAGTPDGQAYIPQEDFNGTARDGESPDAGAYEYDGNGNPGWVVAETFKDYTPNEGRNASNISGGCCGNKKGTPDGSTAAMFLPLGLGVLARRRRRR
ncbi:MAG: right-handed parallel beta-helix repeat-containing protein [Myxococcota bacterium]